ncbi:Zn-ribbon-containing protein [Aliagarivorans marinus]|uniref:Zn-ribbon-containing protein n=1 Tax=Aliagarivorans marinus TaxID=561965 RepID=UPI000419FC07|nr:Zn-ribbon-containing protein [Aliagarivorans marinus]
MYQVELVFECFRDTTISAAERAINHLLNCWRYNGQVLGRELPLILNQAQFECRLICPEQESLHPQFNSPQVNQALSQLSDAGVLRPKQKVLGRDLNSDDIDTCDTRPWQVLYTSYLQACSPLRCGEHFTPVPLYRIPAVANGDHKQVIKWQEDWAACDQLQMNGSVLEHKAVEQLGSPGTRLYRRGWDLCKRIEYLTKIPTYLYLYRVGGESLESEQQRRCPSCGEPWPLNESQHDVIDFRCDNCRLVSNLSWDFKK